MGKIDGAVLNGILKKEPSLKKVVNPFLSDFDINWGAERVAFNTKLYTFIVKPTDTFAETFGLNYELLLVYVPYDSMQARTMQAINSFFSAAPVKGRVESLICIIVSSALEAKEWMNTYVTEYQDLRTYVVFDKNNMFSMGTHSLLTEFRKQLGERDLFDIQLPLLDDMYFFGRQTILKTIHDNIKRCENSGIFGLRKTGKTSLLYKIQRTMESSISGRAFIYDAKNVKIRMRTWTQMVCFIMRDICKAYDIMIPEVECENSIKVVEAFENVLQLIPEQQRIVIIVDEIEYISFNPPLNDHWKKDYFNFWQFLWSMQTTYRNICFVVAGVNPQVVEISSIKTVQNPLFGIVTPYYIQGLERDDIYEMSHRIGRRLGLKFDYTAIDYLFMRYGGHPLLTRLALSYENKNASNKPITFTRDKLISSEKSREEELTPYCQHIVDVLKDNYAEEYMLLEFLAIGATQDFVDLVSAPFVIGHLKNYGLLIYNNQMPQIGIPVVAYYISRASAKNQGAQLAHSIVPKEQRATWLLNNIKSVISYMRQLEVVINKNALLLLFGSNSFPEADKLLEIPVAETENDFKVFISILSNCFVESIQNYGKSISKPNYFWKDIKSDYPNLFDALLRIKAYRNRSEHLKLTKKMQEIVDEYLYIDLEGKNICEVQESDFILQQCTIEKLKLAISLEISNFS